MLKALGELPPLKQHCTQLAEFALKAALGDYFVKTRSDHKLADEITKRIHDPREWRVASADEDCLTVSLPHDLQQGFSRKTVEALSNL